LDLKNYNIMTIKDVKIKNSRVGVHSGGSKEVYQLVTMVIQRKEDEIKDKEIALGLRKRTTLKFIAETYFGTISNKQLELWSKDGELLKTMPKPNGKIIDTYNNWFIVLRNKTIEAFNISGEKVAKGELSDGNRISLHPLNKSK